jgi:hypothetical protein
MGLTNEQIKHILGYSLQLSTINLTIYDIQNKDVLFTTPGSYDAFGVPKTVKYSDTKQYFLDNIIYPEDREEQERIFNSGKIPPFREYRIIHPEKGLRYFRVQASDPIELSNKIIQIIVLMDFTEICIQHDV